MLSNKALKSDLATKGQPVEEAKAHSCEVKSVYIFL